MLVAVAALMLQAQNSVAPTEPAPAEPHLVTRPYWVRVPTGADIARVYPLAAQRSGTEGETRTECRITDGGTLTDCTTVSEIPVRRGFGDAAIALMQKFKMKTVDQEGRSVVGGTIRIPVRWNLPRR